MEDLSKRAAALPLESEILEKVLVALTVALPELMDEVGFMDVSQRLRLFKRGEWNRAKIYLREERFRIAKSFPELYSFLALPFSECYSAVWACCAIQGQAAFGKQAAAYHAERTLDFVTQAIRELREEKKRDEPRSQTSEKSHPENGLPGQ